MNNFQNITIDAMREYANNLRNRIEQLEAKQSKLPHEHLMYVRRGNSIQYYWRNNGKSRKSHYIPKSNSVKIDNLVNANYINKVLPRLKENLAAANSFLSLHSGIEERDIYNSLPEELQIKNGSLFLYKKGYIRSWLKQSYVRNPYMPENLIHDTIRGDKVRSKSEAMIANGVYKHKLPYLLERPLKLKSGKTIYPDLVVLNPITLEEIYWEHFGMMGDPVYAAEACRRIQELHREGIVLGKNLICTFESVDAPLSSALVESYIEQYFG